MAAKADTLAELMGGAADGFAAQVPGATRIIFVPAPIPFHWGWDDQDRPVEKQSPTWRFWASLRLAIPLKVEYVILGQLKTKRVYRYERDPGLSAQNALRFSLAGELSH